MQSTETESSLSGANAEAQLLYAEVHVFVGANCTSIYRVPPGDYLIGRDSSCHLTIDATDVSRMHARLRFSGPQIVIEDLGSANGVHIAGAQINLPTPISPGTEVHIGGARLLIQFSEETSSQIEAALSDPHLGLEIIRTELTREPYEVTGTLGEGGMGMVLQAIDHRIHRQVAMKVLRNGFEYSAEKMLRFVSEAQLTGQLEHPNIVPVYQLGQTSHGQTFYTMKYVRGETLQQVLDGLRRKDPETRKKYPLSALLTIFQKVADAVAFAHSHGVLHRDLKPENIMIGSFGQVLLMDWGLAKRVAATDPATTHTEKGTPKPLHGPKDRKFYTLEGAIVGTPPFICPEQIIGDHEIDERSDIYVMGVILYTIVALRPPLPMHDLDQVIEAIRLGKQIPLDKMIRMPQEDGQPPLELVHCRRGRPPEGLKAIIEKAMQRDPALRYQRMEDFQADITAHQNGYATTAEEAGMFRQIQLLVRRRKREATLLGIFLLISQLLLTYFLGRLAKDRRLLRENQITLNEKKQELEKIVGQLHATADRNYRDALALLNQRQTDAALQQINLALAGVAEKTRERAHYLRTRGRIYVLKQEYIQAMEDFRLAAQISPGLVPIETVELDLYQAAANGIRPAKGWDWESTIADPAQHPAAPRLPLVAPAKK